jgi:hypothetical protein
MTPPAPSPSLRFVRLAASLRHEVDLLAKVVDEAEQAVFDFRESTPSRRELRGVADIIHDFYSGLERVFERIATELEGGAPPGPNWHRDLLGSMAFDLQGLRPPVLSEASVGSLGEYLRFRHWFRNAYGFDLDWDRVRALLVPLSGLWHAVRAELERFIAFVAALGEQDPT